MAGKLADIDDEDIAPEAQAAVINSAGIKTNITFKGVDMVEVKPKDNPGKIMHAAEFVFEDELGHRHVEKYFAPQTSADQLTYVLKKWVEVNNKWTATEDLSKEKTLKVLGNDVVFFLADLAEAMGYPDFEKIRQNIGSRADNFAHAIEIFKKDYPPIPGKKINMKLLWDNNKKKKTSFLKIRTGMAVYYPFMTDLFDRYVADRPSTLTISPYDQENKMKRAFVQADRAPQNAQAGIGGTTTNERQEWKGPTDGGTPPPMGAGPAPAGGDGWI